MWRIFSFSIQPGWGFQVLGSGKTRYSCTEYRILGSFLVKGAG